MGRTTSAVGSLLRSWRGARHMSQLDLALVAEVSPRHLSFVETGRAEPSREMVLTLARALEVPFRECNAMLGAAGYASVYRETSLDDVQMAEMRRAIDLLLHQHEPFFAVAMDRRWDIVMCNAAYAGFLRTRGAGGAPGPGGREPRRMRRPAHRWSRPDRGGSYGSAWGRGAGLRSG